MDNITNELTQYEIDELLLPIIEDMVKNNLTLKEACRRANVPYTLAKQVMKQPDIEREKDKRAFIREIKKLLSYVSDEIQTIKKNSQRQP